MRLYLYHNFVKMLYDGTIYGACQIGMMPRNDSCFVSDPIVDVLRCAIKPEATIKRETYITTPVSLLLQETGFQI